MERPKLYVEDDDHKIGIQNFVSDFVYAEAIKAFVIVCADTVLVNGKRQTIFLVKRSVRPMKGWWIIGGRVLAGEGEEDAVVRIFKRETGLVLSRERFKFLRVNRYWWRDREQEPHEVGSDNLAYTFSLELSPEELAQAEVGLEPRELDPSVGLVEFDRKKLIKECVHQSVIDMYDQIFPDLSF